MSGKDRALILWFDEVGSGDTPLVGGKNANLGELTRAGIPAVSYTHLTLPTTERV